MGPIAYGNPAPQQVLTPNPFGTNLIGPPPAANGLFQANNGNGFIP